MVKPTFSEFQFAYGLTRELEGPRPGMGLIDVPVIPTQNLEADIPADMASRIRNGDIELAPLFIQYKRAEKMTRSYAREWDDLDRMYGVDDHYFRFNVYLGDSDQHNKLVELGERQPLTFYVAPAFVEQDEYRRHAVNNRIFEHSAFIQCGELDTVPDEDHVVAWTFPDPDGIVLSEPTSITVRQGGEDAFDVEEIDETLRSFGDLRESFGDLRRDIAFGPDEEQDRFGADFIGDPDDYDSGEPVEWMRTQKQFFMETADADLKFFSYSEE